MGFNGVFSVRTCYPYEQQSVEIYFGVVLKVKAGDDQEMAQSERNTHFKTRGGKIN